MGKLCTRQYIEDTQTINSTQFLISDHSNVHLNVVENVTYPNIHIHIWYIHDIVRWIIIYIGKRIRHPINIQYNKHSFEIISKCQYPFYEYKSKCSTYSTLL